MGIEPTSLSDMLTTPELSAEPGNRGAGQDFAAFLSAHAPDPQGAVGPPTGLVGNPTPEGDGGEVPSKEIQLADGQATAATATPENPLQAVMMIADRLGLRAKPVKAPPVASGTAEIPSDIPPPSKVEGKDETDIDIDHERADDGQVDETPAMPAGTFRLQALPDQPSQAPPVAVVASPDATRPAPADAVPAATGRPLPKIPDAPAIAVQRNDTADEMALPPLPAATGRTQAPGKAVGNSTAISATRAGVVDLPVQPDMSPHKGHASASVDDIVQASQTQAQAQAAPDIQIPAAADRHDLTTSAALTPSVVASAPSVVPAHQQVLENLLVGNAVEDQWVDRLSQDVQTLISSDNREARLRLRPRELGDLSIRLDINDGQARVHFTVETAAAQALIADAAPRLHAMLENKGVKLDQASVDIGSGAGGKGGQGGSGQQDAQPFMAKAPPSVLAAALRRAARLTAFERYA